MPFNLELCGLHGRIDPVYHLKSMRKQAIQQITPSEGNGEGREGEKERTNHRKHCLPANVHIMLRYVVVLSCFFDNILKLFSQITC